MRRRCPFTRGRPIALGIGERRIYHAGARIPKWVLYLKASNDPRMWGGYFEFTVDVEVVRLSPTVVRVRNIEPFEPDTLAQLARWCNPRGFTRTFKTYNVFQGGGRPNGPVTHWHQRYFRPFDLITDA